MPWPPDVNRPRLDPVQSQSARRDFLHQLDDAGRDIALQPGGKNSAKSSWMSQAPTLFLLEKPNNVYAGHQPTSPVTNAMAPMTA